MPELLLELFSEEIPARMQKRAEEDLARALNERLQAAGFPSARNGKPTFSIATFSTPRRIGAVIENLDAKTGDYSEMKRGPRVGAPEAAIAGFLRSAGLKSINEAKIVEDKKGSFYEAHIERAGRDTPAILQDVIPEIIRAFPWPKSMRSQSSDLQWVRPLHNILCLFDGAPVKISVDTIASKPVTQGHRFHAPGEIKVTSVAQYKEALAGAHVVLEREERKRIILEGAKQACAARGLELVEDAGLLEEVAGLAEWPVVLLGDMDPAFLDLPGEVIRLSMRTHQKYFAVRDPNTQKLAPHFVTVANVSAKDGGKAIAAGNARVLSARLNDARFFWDADKKTPLFTEERKAKLEKIVFHQKLGSVWDKVERVKALAVELCTVTGADAELVSRAAELCKCDLVTETVGEFPELQGQIGRQLYLAEISPLPRGEGAAQSAAGEGRADNQAPERLHAPHPPTPSPQGRRGEESIAIAIEDHYRPLGPNDRVPTDKVAVTLALADKLDTLVGFWAIDEKPTGSSDPYALRRAALGIVRVVLQSGIRVNLSKLFAARYRLMLVESALGLGLLLEGFEDLSRLADGFSGGADLLRELRSSPIAFAFEYDGLIAACEKHVLLFANDNDPPDQYYEAVRRLSSRSNALEKYAEAVERLPRDDDTVVLFDGTVLRLDKEAADEARNEFVAAAKQVEPIFNAFCGALTAFLADRLKVQLRDQGKRHDLVDAVFALGDDDLVRIVARVEALDVFLKSQDGANLLAGYKRAANILAAEEKKGKWSAEEAKGAVEPKLLAEAAEKALHAALETALPAARAAVEKEDFAAAMKALSGLRAPVDAFFEGVLVNADDPALRRNRLLLLSRLVEALSAVADFSKIEG
ncbi:MAG: glycine--tRNA ligase subunit beta [Hyphomonadaceae bacterium]|nr:glycine--tRNA ligase subunit beta [Hyphomonadaceae bacterium]